MGKSKDEETGRQMLGGVRRERVRVRKGGTGERRRWVQRQKV